MRVQNYGTVLNEIDEEIERANSKHGHGPLATPLQLIAILSEELGEFAQATMKGQTEHAKEELVQVAAVALNFLCGTGPHFSNK